MGNQKEGSDSTIGPDRALWKWCIWPRLGLIFFPFTFDTPKMTIIQPLSLITLSLRPSVNTPTLLQLPHPSDLTRQWLWHVNHQSGPKRWIRALFGPQVRFFCPDVLMTYLFVSFNYDHAVSISTLLRQSEFNIPMSYHLWRRGRHVTTACKRCVNISGTR